MAPWPAHTKLNVLTRDINPNIVSDWSVTKKGFITLTPAGDGAVVAG